MLLPLAALVCVGGVSPVVRAAPADAPTAPDAKKVTDGADAVRKGDFASALRLFDEAYAMSQNPKLHYNIAVAYEGLGRLTDAYEEFGRFLAEAVNVPVEFRAEASRRRDGLRAKLAAVRLPDAPAGATVSIDGQLRGKTPLREDLVVSAGAHTIIVERPGYTPFTKTFDAPAGQTVDVSSAAPVVTAPPVVAPPAPAASAADAPTTVVATLPDAPPRAGAGDVRLALGFGAALWAGGVPDGSPASIAFSLDGAFTAARVQEGRTALQAGVRLALTPLADSGHTDTFFGALAEARVEHVLAGDETLVFASLAAGPLVIGGLQTESRLWRAGVVPRDVGTLVTLDVNPSIGMEHAFSDTVAVFVAVNADFAPLKSDWFADSLSTRVGLAAGLAVRL